MSDYATELAAGWLAQMWHDPARAIEGMQATLAQLRGGSHVWADLLVRLSENHDPATPWPDPHPTDGYCDYCGNSAPDELVPGPDGPGRPEKACRDDLLDACLSRRAERYPPSSDRAPDFVVRLAAAESEEAGLGDLIKLAVSSAAERWLAGGAVWPDDMLALTQTGSSVNPDQAGPYAVPYVQAYATYDRWSHTLRAAHNRRHLVSGGQGQGGDIPQGQQQVQPGEPVLPAQRPDRAPQPRPRRRRGYRLQYTPARRQPRTADGSDDPGSGGVDGPSGGSAET